MMAHVPSSPEHVPLLLERWVAFVQRYAKTTLAIAGLFTLAAVLYTLGELGFKTNRDDLVHPSEEYYRDWQRYARIFGAEPDIVVVVEGNDRARMTAALEAIAGEIEAYPGYFTRLCHRIDADKLRTKGLYQLSLDDLHEVARRLDGIAPLLAGATGSLAVDQLLGSARFVLHPDATRTVLPHGAREQIADVTRLTESLACFLEDGTIYRSPWRHVLAGRPSTLADLPQFFFSDSGRIALLRVAPVEQGVNFVNFAEPVALMGQILDRVGHAFPELEFGLTGIAVLETDEMRAAKQAGTASTILTVVGVSILFIAAFRAIWRPFFAIVTVLVGGCWTMGWVSLTVGHLNILSVSFIVTLVGLGIDFGILWLTRYETRLADGLSPPRANCQTARGVGQAIVVGGVTTAIAFFTTMVTGFLGLQEMGWIAGSGVLLCLLATFTVLPALLVVAENNRVVAPHRSRDAQPVLTGVTRYPATVLVCISIAVTALALQIPNLHFDYNLLNMQKSGLASVFWEHRILDETGTSGWYALSVANSAEEARELGEQFRALESVGRVVEIASLIPPNQPAKNALIRTIHAALAGFVDRPEPAGNVRPLTEAIREHLMALSEAPMPSPVENQLVIGPLRAAARRAFTALAQLPSDDQMRRLDRFEQLWRGDLFEQLRRLYAVSGPDPIDAADLPDQLLARYWSEGKWLVQIFPRQSAWDLEPLQTFCDELASVDPHATGRPVSTLHNLKQMTRGYAKSAWIAGIVVFLIVWIGFRSIVAAFFAMLPLLLGCLAMFGMMATVGIALNPANMIGLPLIFGIGIDYGVHIMHDYHETTGRYRLTWRLARALTLTSTTTIIGFASLMIAPHWGMKSIGLVLVIGVSASYLSAIFFLPAALYLLSYDASDNGAVAPRVEADLCAHRPRELANVQASA